MKRDKIVSAKNARVKNVVQLRKRREREASGLTIVEGLRESARASEGGVEFKEFFICPDMLNGADDLKLIKKIAGRDTPLFETSAEVFSKLAFGNREEGVLAVCRPQRFRLSDLKLSQKPLLVVAERVEKPGNLGAVIRSCDGAGVDALIICEALTDIYNPNVVRASLGTVFTVPIFVCSNTDVKDFLKENNIQTYVTRPQAKKTYTAVDFNVPAAIVVGSEQEGVSGFWNQPDTVKVKIPMKGKADSLNVSATAAVMIYEALRQRNR